MKKFYALALTAIFLAGCSASDLTEPVDEDRSEEVKKENAPVSMAHELTYQDSSYGELLETTITLQDGRKATCLVTIGGGDLTCFEPAAAESEGELP